MKKTKRMLMAENPEQTFMEYFFNETKSRTTTKHSKNRSNRDRTQEMLNQRKLMDEEMKKKRKRPK